MSKVYCKHRANKGGTWRKNARTTKGTPKIHPAPNSNWNILEALINICNQGAWSIGPYWQRPHCTALGIERSNASWGTILVNAIHPAFFRYPYNMGYRPTVPLSKLPRFQQKEWPPTSHIYNYGLRRENKNENYWVLFSILVSQTLKHRACHQRCFGTFRTQTKFHMVLPARSS